MIYPILLLLLIGQISCAHEPYASVHLTGTLYCNESIYQHEKVEVWEKNYIMADSWATTVTTDENGYFEMKATVRDDYFPPKPYFYMINWCKEKQWWNDKETGDKLVCSEPLKVFIPKEYVTPGREAKKTFDFTQVNLAMVETQFAGLEIVLQTVLSQKGECRRILKKDRTDLWDN
ncbi:hypothetical protein GCK72_021893 [Caenorhabditis remanei]|uniref:Uncharacterized protein n=1 Tax=Caenorhabditis remanei TaxID=31234 RepID=A0A6A5GKY4_CAERE|nr:hypothetical protein GCK72_021893 [Caenorhabditis remanei]KAF1755324.1 hypothetical protein GCK72_021893 [Caenorhabditis remanei]